VGSDLRPLAAELPFAELPFAELPFKVFVTGLCVGLLNTAHSAA
jgi:hypothetical protein